MPGAANGRSVCVDPRDARVMRVAVSTGGTWQSDDGGETWRQTGEGMFAEYMPPEQRFNLAAQDVHRMVQCPASPDRLWIQHHNGVFRSDDGGLQWQEIKGRPSVFGFAVVVHPRDPDTAWFVPAVKDETRIPVDARFVVSRTRDGGRTFDVLTKGLPEGPAYDIVYRHALAVDATGERVAASSTTGGLWVSEDGGDSWQLLSAHLPPIHAVTFA